MLFRLNKTSLQQSRLFNYDLVLNPIYFVDTLIIFKMYFIFFITFLTTNVHDGLSISWISHGTWMILYGNCLFFLKWRIMYGNSFLDYNNILLDGASPQTVKDLFLEKRTTCCLLFMYICSPFAQFKKIFVLKSFSLLHFVSFNCCK